jgi:uncharacterized protein YecE (DUF72 family)
MEKNNIFVGTSGWTYADWQGTFYPENVKGPDRLVYYAGKFNTVEVNSTFYRIPYGTMIKAWNQKLGPGFHLVVKGSRAVTHLKKLKDCQEPLQVFLDRVLQLNRLQVILWQLPPSLHKDVKLFDSFLSQLPKQVRHAVEFRHKSWWDKEVVEVLSKHDSAFVSLSHPQLPDMVYPTTDFLYLRFHGLGKNLYQYNYSDDELTKAAIVVTSHLAGRTLYAFFNNDYHAFAPTNAETFRQMLGQGGAFEQLKPRA